MITFGMLHIKGFCSIQELSFDLNRQGLNVIQAKNGRGKTTLFSALTWVLFGQTLKRKNKVNTWKHIQPDDYNGTRVSILLNKDGINYQIIRCDSFGKKVLGSKGKDRLILLQEGKERTDLRTKPETQKEINSLLGFSFDLFINSVIFGQKLKRIIQETGPRKKEVFEEAFEVVYLNEAKKVALKKKSDYDERLSNLQPLLMKFQTQKDLFFKQWVEAVKQEKIFKAQNDLDIKITRNGIKELKLKLNDYNQIEETTLRDKKKTVEMEIRELEKLRGQRLEAEKRFFKLEMELANLQGQADKALSDNEKLKGVIWQPKICRVCGSKIPKEKRLLEQKKIKADIKSNKLAYTAAVSKMDGVNADIRALKSIFSSMQNLETALESFNKQLKELEAALWQQENNKKHLAEYSKKLRILKTQLKAFKARKFSIDLPKLKSQYQEAKDKLKPLKADHNNLTKKLDIYNWLIKVPLSNSGIKAFIFEYMIGLVNEQLDEYSKIVGFKVNFGINMDSSKRDFFSSVIREGYEVPYEELSGGEQQLVDVIIAFAIHDTISLEKNINLIVLDECFESLDAENIEIVTEILQQKAKDKAVWLITHLEGFSSSNSKIIQLSKSKKGFTKLVTV